jgi:hypothetical protein
VNNRVTPITDTSHTTSHPLDEHQQQQHNRILYGYRSIQRV